MNSRRLITLIALWLLLGVAGVLAWRNLNAQQLAAQARKIGEEQPAEALALVRRAVQTAPWSRAYKYDAAQILLQVLTHPDPPLETAREGWSALRRWIDADPQNARLWMYAGQILELIETKPALRYGVQRELSSGEAYERMQALAPNHGYYALIHARYLLRRGQERPAADRLIPQLHEEYSSVISEFVFEKRLGKIVENPPFARQLADALVTRTDNGRTDGERMLLAKLWMLGGRYDAALSTLDEILAHNPIPAAQNLKARILIADGRPEEAEAVFRALGGRLQMVEVVRLAQQYFSQRKFAEVRRVSEEWTRGLGEWPLDLLQLNMRACLLIPGDNERAIYECGVTIGYRWAESKEHGYLGLIWLARINLRFKNYMQAEYYCHQAIRLLDNPDEGVDLLKKIYIAQGISPEQAEVKALGKAMNLKELPGLDPLDLTRPDPGRPSLP